MAPSRNTRSDPNISVRVFLCGSPSQLLFALIDIALCQEPTDILYIDDIHPLDPAVSQRLVMTFPDVRLIKSTDLGSQADFTNLPPLCPAILRRNLRWDGLLLTPPMGWKHGPLGARSYERAYTFHTGPFLAKVLAGAADQLILREDGLSNYYRRPMSASKRFFRFLAGYRTATQIMGDEHWVDHIEVSKPENLPGELQVKASQFDPLEQSAELSPEAIDQIITVFAPTDPELPDPSTSAVLLTQPLDSIGMGTISDKIKLYQALAEILLRRGYSVYVKNHPREIPYILRGTIGLNNKIPTELWTLSGKEPFQLGVSLCSAGLMLGQNGFCRTSVQLVDPSKFVASEYSGWKSELPARLIEAVSECGG